MKLVGVVIGALIPLVMDAQLESFEGKYLVGVTNENNDIFLEENCWTEDIDHVELSTEYSEENPTLTFNGFHNELLDIQNVKGNSAGITFQAFNADEEYPVIRNFQLTKIQRKGKFIYLLSEGTNTTLLVPEEDKTGYNIMPCDGGKGEDIDIKTIHELSIQIFESLATADQNKFSEFTTDAGFKFLNNKQEETLISISQLFEKSAYVAWMRYVAARTSNFACLDTFTPFDPCSPNESKPILMIKTYPEDMSSVDIHVMDTKNNPYRMIIGCSIKEKWLFIKYIIVDVCIN